MMDYTRLHGLKPEDYQHKGEVAAMKVLKGIPLFDVLLGKALDLSVKVNQLPNAVGNYYRITEKTNSRVYDLYKLALSRLDMNEEYPLFSKLDYNYNAYTTGVKEPVIVIHSSCIKDYTDGELLNIIGHEIGHIKSGHMLYHTMASLMNSILGSFGGIAQGASVAIQYGLMNWKRNSEYTADRAGLIAALDINEVNSETMKMLGHSSNIKDIDYSLDKVMKQVDDFNLDTSGIIGKLLYVSYTAKQTHPWSILRLKQINDWYDSGQYQDVVNQYINNAI